MKTLKQLVDSNDFKSITGFNVIQSEINQLDEYHYSLLHTALFNNYIETAEVLIQSGIDVNIQDKNGQTALHYAALFNQENIARLLLNNSASLDIEDNYGNQPLWTAVFNDKGRNERIKIILLFMEFGADPNHKNKVDKSPTDIIKIASYFNLIKIVR